MFKQTLNLVYYALSWTEIQLSFDEFATFTLTVLVGSESLIGLSTYCECGKG